PARGRHPVPLRRRRDHQRGRAAVPRGDGEDPGVGGAGLAQQRPGLRDLPDPDVHREGGVLPAGRGGDLHRAVRRGARLRDGPDPAGVRQAGRAGRFPHLHPPAQGPLAAAAAAGDGVHQDDARSEHDLGRGRPRPRLHADGGERGVPRPRAPALLRRGRGLRGLRRRRLVRRLRLDLRGHRRRAAGAGPAGGALPGAGPGRDPQPARDLHLDPQPALTRKAYLMTTMSPTAAPAGRAPAASARQGGKVLRRTPQAWLFLAPFAVIYLAFMVGPMIWMIVASFFNTSTVRSGLGSFAGLDNYKEMFARDDFWSSLWHTLQFTLYTVPPLVVLSFVLAVLTNRMARGQWFFRLAFFLPFILPSPTISLICVFIFTPTSGLWSLPATLLGLDPGAGVLSSPSTAMIGIAIATVWWTIGFNFVLYLAGLQEIPRELYEAAAVDGATPWQQIRRVTVPLLNRPTGLVILLQIIASLKIFDQVYLMTSGGPRISTQVSLGLITNPAFTDNRVGAASAASVLLFLIIVVIAIL